MIAKRASTVVIDVEDIEFEQSSSKRGTVLKIVEEKIDDENRTANKLSLSQIECERSAMEAD